jgi:hypothetical protein
VYLHAFLTWALLGGEWSDLRLSRFNLWKRNPELIIKMRLGGPQDVSGRYEEERNILILRWIEPQFLYCPTRYLVAIPTKQFRFPCLTNITAQKRLYLQYLILEVDLNYSVGSSFSQRRL